MTKTYNTLLLMNSLSVFRNILERNVIKGYKKLLESASMPPERFLCAYGEFFNLLSERGMTESLAAYNAGGAV